MTTTADGHSLKLCIMICSRPAARHDRCKSDARACVVWRFVTRDRERRERVVRSNVYTWPCSPSPLARPKARHFGPAQARHGPKFIGPGLARHGGAGRAWAALQARRPARPGPPNNGRPDTGPLPHQAGRHQQPGRQPSRARRAPPWLPLPPTPLHINFRPAGPRGARPPHSVSPPETLTLIPTAAAAAPPSLVLTHHRSRAAVAHRPSVVGRRPRTRSHQSQRRRSLAHSLSQIGSERSAPPLDFFAAVVLRSGDIAVAVGSLPLSLSSLLPASLSLSVSLLPLSCP